MSYKEVYEELSLLGEGGMGKVYLVRHRRLGVLRAMKVVRKDDATKLVPSRFMRKIVCRLRLNEVSRQ